MKENKINTANVNYNIWKDKFLPEGQEPSDDYLPPELKTYCKVVDGISNDNNLPIFVVPIYVPNDSFLLDNGDYTDGGSGIEQILRNKSRINYEKNKKREKLYPTVSQHIRDLTDNQKPFGLLYVYHNDKVITHVEPYMHFFNQNDKHNMVSMTDLNEHETEIIDKQIYGEEANFISTCSNNNVKLIKDSYGRAVDSILINNGTEICKNRFGCRILAIQFLLSCLKEQQALQGVFNIERVNDIMAIKDSKSYFNNNYGKQLDQSALSNGNIPLVTDFSRGILGNDFNKLHEVNLDTLATELCLQKQILQQYVDVDEIVRCIKNILVVHAVLTESAKKYPDVYEQNIQSLTKVLNDFYKFAKKQSAFEGKIIHIDDVKNEDIEELGSKYGTVNNFLDEIKIRTRLILTLFIEDEKIQPIMDNIFPKGDVKRWMKGDKYLPRCIKHGLYEKIAHELLKVIYDVKETEINGMKQKLEKENIFRKAKDGKYYNVNLARLGAEWYAKYANKKFLEEHNEIIRKYGNVDSLAYAKYKQCEHIEAINEVYQDYLKRKKFDTKEINSEHDEKKEEEEKNKILNRNNNNKQQESTKDGAAGNRCWPFWWCSSCNGCACINKGIDEYQQTLGNY